MKKNAKIPIEPYKIEPNRWYNIADLVKLKMLPFNNNRETLLRLIKRDLASGNILEAETLAWTDRQRATYRIRGDRYLNYIALKGYNKTEGVEK